MKVATIFALVALPDEFEGGLPDVLRFMLDRPRPYSTDLPDEETGLEQRMRSRAFDMAELATWRHFRACAAADYRSVVTVVARHLDDEAGTQSFLDPRTFKPLAEPDAAADAEVQP